MLFIGLGMTAVGVVLLRRQYTSGLGLGRGRLVSKLASPAEVVGRTTSNGMTVEHRRSKDMSIEQRVRTIQDMVWKGVQQPEMRKLALQITRKCPERDGKCEAKAIYDYVKRHVRYTGDVAPIKMGADGPVEAVDFYQRADRTLEFGGGDCDDHSILGATLLSLNGIPARLRVTAEPNAPDFGHIYTVADVSKGGLQGKPKWEALDTTLPGNNKFGVEVPYGKSLDFPA